jgi:hypothetical protein
MLKIDLMKKYPRSEPCACSVCLGYCRRPGWWTVSQATIAMRGGYAARMMLEVSPERSSAVLSPSFRGCEGKISTQEFAARGCNFLLPDNACELHATPFLPLECAFCHHSRVGQGRLCHGDLEKDWQSVEGKTLVRRWCRQMGWWDLLEAFGLGGLKK